jgi:cytochrome P450
MIVPNQWGAHSAHFWLSGGEPGSPVEFDEQMGQWNVHGYAEAQQVLSDPATFGSNLLRLYPPIEDPVMSRIQEGNLLQMDGVQHRNLRRLAGKVFTPKVVAGLEPRIAELTRDLLDKVDGRDEFDFIASLAHPLPVIVIADMLGVPADDHQLFQHWVDKLFESKNVYFEPDPGVDVQEAAQAAFAEFVPMLDYLATHVAERRRAPRADLLSMLVQAEVEGERLTDDQVVGFADLLLIAGHVTTTLLLGSTVLCLDAYPDAAEAVRQDRALLPSAIEESLRLVSPVPVVARASTVDTVLGGVQVPADKIVMVWLGAANRDERRFDDPGAFRPDRDPNPHLAFGRGSHFCLGAPLARLEGRIVMDIVLDRFPVLRTVPGRPPRFQPTPEMTGPRTLPVRTFQ